MGQKVSPVGIRLGITRHAESHWYANKSEYALFIQEDQHIRNYVHRTRAECRILKIEIERQALGVRLRISSMKAIALVGSGGKRLKTLCSELHRECLIIRRNYFSLSHLPERSSPQFRTHRIQVFVRKVDCPESNASCLANFMSMALEKRVPFRRVFRTVQDRARNFGNVKGLRLQISGRLNGAEIARVEWVRRGRVPLHTFSADLDYACQSASTTYGLLGVKVWIFSQSKEKSY